MSEELSIAVLAVLLVCGLTSGLSTIWFLQKRCAKSCRISQMVFGSIGAIACFVFLAAGAPDYDLIIAPWISIGAPESLNISWQFRIDRIAATSLLMTFSSIATVVAMPWKGACPYSQHERSFVAGTAASLATSALLFLAGDLYLLLFAWAGLSGVTFFLFHQPSHQNVDSQRPKTTLKLLANEFICFVGVLVVVCILGASLRALELPELLAMSTMESLYPENLAMIDMIGLGIAVAILCRSVQFPFFASLPVFSTLELRRFWLFLLTVVFTPSIFLALKFFELWHFGAVIPNLVSTLGVISVLYFGLLATVSSRLTERTVALSIMPIAVFWIACGFPSFAVLVVTICFVVVATTSVVLFSAELSHNFGRARFSPIGFVVSFILFLVLWTFIKVMRTGSTQSIDEFDGIMASALLLGITGLTRTWLQARQAGHQKLISTAANHDEIDWMNGLEPSRIVLFALSLIAGVGVPVIINGIGDQNPFAKPELRESLIAGIIYLLPLSIIAVVLGCGLGWWLDKHASLCSTPSHGLFGSLVRIIQQHLYVPRAIDFIWRLGSILLGPAVLVVERRLLWKYPNQLTFGSGIRVRMAIERAFFSGESLLVATVVMSIAILSATLIW